MVDITKLKSKADKGAPPPPEQLRTVKGSPPRETPPRETNENLSDSLRERPVAKAKIEFSVPEGLLNEFAQEAGRRFGFKKGSKSNLFVALWEEYKGRLP